MPGKPAMQEDGRTAAESMNDVHGMRIDIRDVLRGRRERQCGVQTRGETVDGGV